MNGVCKSQRVLVTGASSGIGFSLARGFADQGCDVVGVARDFETKRHDAASLRDFSGIDTQSLDLSNIDQLARELKSHSAMGGAFDTLVLNAGYGQFGAIEQFSVQQIRHLVDTNLVSNLLLVKHFLPKMRTQGQGDVVIIGSESALQGAKLGAVYCATKFALRGMAQSLRYDCAGSNIRVILVNPGPVGSDFFDDLDFKPQDGIEFVIDPDDIANIVLNALFQPRNVVCDEINVQPLKRSFQKNK